MGAPKGHCRICVQRTQAVWLGFIGGENFLSSLSKLNSCEFGRKGTTSSHSYRKLLNREDLLAEGEGFEPPVPFQAQRFSRPPVSTAHPSLRFLDRHVLFHKFTSKVDWCAYEVDCTPVTHSRLTALPGFGKPCIENFYRWRAKREFSLSYFR